jgi:hypothetical protein
MWIRSGKKPQINENNLGHTSQQETHTYKGQGTARVSESRQ